MSNFKIGDIVVCNDLANPYIFTTKGSRFVGVVVGYSKDHIDDLMEVVVLENKHEFAIGKSYMVSESFFKKRDNYWLSLENKTLLDEVGRLELNAFDDERYIDQLLEENERLDKALCEKEKMLSFDIYFDDEKETTLIIDGNDNFTTVKTMSGDEYDREKVFLVAYFQHTSGLSETEANKLLKSFSQEEE